MTADPPAVDPGALERPALEPGALEPPTLEPGALDPPTLGPGAALARDLHRDLVGPLLDRELPGLRYAAGRLGSGSDVLGLDDPVSRDHDWGTRLTVLVDAADRAVLPRLDAVLERDLPARYRGLPVRFATTWDPRVRHRVQVATVGDFATSRLGLNPLAGLEPVDWLTLTGQAILETVGGPVFHDATRELGRLRAQLAGYPPQVELFVLAAGWRRLAERLPLLGRTGQRGHYLGCRLLGAGLAGTLIRQAFLLHRQWAPYDKWLEARFSRLPGADELTGPLRAAVDAGDWARCEAALGTVTDRLLAVQCERGLPTPERGLQPFWDRPYLMLAEQVPGALESAITEPVLARLPVGVGSIEQWVDNVNVLTGARQTAIRAAYRAWLEPTGSTDR